MENYTTVHTNFDTANTSLLMGLIHIDVPYDCIVLYCTFINPPMELLTGEFRSSLALNSECSLIKELVRKSYDVHYCCSFIPSQVTAYLFFFVQNSFYSEVDA